MIPSGVQVFVALEPVDLRWSFDRLAGAAVERIGYDARSGALFIFFGKRKDAVKLLFFDGSGMCLFYKRLLCASPHMRKSADRERSDRRIVNTGIGVRERSDRRGERRNRAS